MASKKSLMIKRTEEHLDLHRGDPATYPLNVEAVAAFVPVSRRLFYKNDPEIEALLDHIPSGASTNRAPASAEATEQTDAMEDSTLDRTIDQVVARAVWTMQKFVGHHKGTPRTVEAALAAHDLDEAIGTLLRYQRELAPLVTEYCRRQKEPVGFEQVEVPPNSQLSLLPILGG